MKPYCILLTWSLIADIMEARQSRLMETLSCSTDYESRMDCTWSELQEANTLVKMHLFHKEKYSNLTKMMCNSQELDSQIHWNCSRNENIFNTLRNDVFIFKPDRELEIQLNVDLFNNIRPLPPEKLNVTVIKERDFLLEWKAGGGTNRNHLLGGLPLDFQITYKRTWELWEESSSVLISNRSHYLLRHNNLVPGSRYIARVRSRPSQGSGFAGHYSDWSPAVTWQTWEDDALPKNLQCYFNGIDRFKCSWEVRQEVSSSVLFTLFYKDNPGSEEVECPEVYQVPLISNNATYHVLQSCEINVINPNQQYLVRVGPKEEAKEIKIHWNIKPYPPYNLAMPVLDGPKYILKWNSKKINEHLELQKIYQISYWETGKPLEAQDVYSETEEFTFTSLFLELGKSYTAKARVKVNKSGYNGSWSEWSEEFVWPTTRVFPLWGILPITVIFIILMMAGICFCQKYLLSVKKEWEANIPSPPKTFLLPSFFPKVKLANHSEDNSTQSSLAEEGISHTSKLERELLIGSSAATEDGSRKTPHLVWSQDIKKIDPLHKDNTGKNCTSPNVQAFDFNGPYIYSSSESFIHTVQQDLKVTPSEMKETPVSLQYMGLPPFLSLQQQPVGKKKNALSNVHQQMEKKLLFPTGQEASHIQETSGQLEKEETEGWRPRCRSSSNSHCQNLPLDYIAAVDLSISKEKGCLLPLPVLTSEEGMLSCANTTVAAQLPKTIENLSDSELCKKTSQPLLPVMDKGVGDPSAVSQEESNDYIMNFSATSGSVSKDGLAFAMEEPKQDILIFSLGSRSPVFLYQEGEYCFFPGSKPTMKDCKGQKAPVGHQSPEIFPKVTKSPCETKCADSKLQVTSQVCQDM